MAQKSLLKKLPFILPIIAFLGLAIISAIGLYGNLSGTRNQEQLPSVLIGQKAPALPATAYQPELAKTIEAFQGQPILVNFMASWCAPCKAEAPALALLAEDVPIIGIAYKDKLDDTSQFLEQFGNPYSALWMDYDGRTAIEWGVYGVPETFVIDGDGTIIVRHAGPIFKEVLTDIIRPALQDLK